MAHTSSHTKICPDCGPATVNHTVAKTSVILGFLIRVMTVPLSKIEDAIVEVLFPYIEYGMPHLFTFLSLLRLGELTDEMREDNIDRTKCMWRAAKERGIAIRQFRILGRPSIIFFAEYGGKRIMFEGLPRPKGGDHSSLTWMDNKGIMREKFRAGGIPVAQGGVVMTKQGALALFRTLTPPVITKPNLGSRSRHTTTHITTEEGLLEGFRKANQLSPWVVLEEELQGFVYRVTLIGGKLEGALRREPPFVTGNGSATVRTLVEKENQNPKRHNWVFHEIAMDADAEEELKRQGLSWESVPEVGAFVTLNQKIGRGQGGSNTEMLPKVHPDNVVLFEKIGRVLGDALVGIDFIMQDIEKSWTEQKRIGVIECNSLPFLDLHHMPLYGEPLDPSGKLWDVVFPEAKKALRS